MDNKMDWVNSAEKQSGEYFNVSEGENRIQLLSHCAPYILKWTGSKYEPAEEGDTNTSVKGVCWVLHDGVIKLATLPYTVVKAIKGFMEDTDYSFEEFPMPRLINIKAKGAGTKEVEYVVIPSPNLAEVSQETLEELKSKPSPEEMVEKMKSKKSATSTESTEKSAGVPDYPDEEINPEDIPF